MTWSSWPNFEASTHKQQASIISQQIRLQSWWSSTGVSGCNTEAPAIVNLGCVYGCVNLLCKQNPAVCESSMWRLAFRDSCCADCTQVSIIAMSDSRVILALVVSDIKLNTTVALLHKALTASHDRRQIACQRHSCRLISSRGVLTTKLTATRDTTVSLNCCWPLLLSCYWLCKQGDSCGFTNMAWLHRS